MEQTTQTNIAFTRRGQVLQQIYRVWLFRKLLPVIAGEIVLLTVILYVLGQAVFIQRIFENALKVFFINPPQIIGFLISAFFKASLATKVLGFGVLVVFALIIRHATQGLLRLVLIKEKFFAKVGPEEKKSTDDTG